MSIRPTAEQQAAIDARGKIIVSASAGSGKTAVMIERLVTLVLNGADVREMLAVTYTRKAAAQMREKLRAALIERIGSSEEADRNRLKEQLKQLPLADICTMHVFCARLIRSYFYLLDVGPDFRIIGDDDADAKTYSARALDETFEHAYAEGGEAFSDLLSVYYRRKSDKTLREIVVSLQEKVRGRAEYRSWLATVGQNDGLEELAAFLHADFTARVRECLDRAKECEAYFCGSSASACRVSAAVIAAAEPLLSASDLFEMTACAGNAPALPRMPSSTKATGEELKMLKMLSAAKESVSSVYQDLQTFAPQEIERGRYDDALKRTRSLARLVLDYDERLTALKREAGVLSYNDLEHCALAVLQNDEARAAVRARYRYLFVDEYQDVNLIQEQLLELLGGDEIFYVGDAKQAIYAFRGSRSDYFMKKTEQLPCSLKLSESFRSAPAVLEAVNRVFSRAMTEPCGGIDYRNTAQMSGGSRYGVHGGEVLFHRIPSKEREERETRGVYSVCKESAPKANREARLIADLVINEVQGKTFFDADEGRERPVDFGDIAVLVRKKTGTAEALVSELSARGVPVSTTADVNICEYWEVRLLLDWLSFLDNPRQDIACAAAMLSFVGGFSEADLVAVRERFPSAFRFRDACAEYRTKMQNGLSERLIEFEEKAERYRTLACVKSAAEMINLLLADGLEAEIAAKQDGEMRLMRVQRLVGAAEGNVNTFLHRVQATGNNMKFNEGGGEHAVKILTMHASKGLEYPVVILANMDSPFHGADKDEVLYSERFGFAPFSFDKENKIVYPNLQRRVCALEQVREETKGELNLLYVAMTRAKYRLHVLLKGEGKVVSPQYAKNFAQFLDLADCEHYFADSEETEGMPLPREAWDYRADSALVSEVLGCYRQPYAFSESTTLPVKSSATELLKTAEKDFSGVSRAVSSSSSVEEGVAYHAFLQHVTFGADAKAELTRMKRERLLTEEQAALLREEKLEQILQMPSLRPLQGQRIWREQTFLLSLSARELGLGESDDLIVLQGAIDLLTVDGNGYTVLDYKYSVRTDEELKRTYAPQIELYRKAVAKAMNVAPERVRARLLNILQLHEIEL